MKTKNLVKTFVAMTGCLFLGFAHGEGDPQVGKYKFSTCTGCHSIPGYTNVYPTYHVPKLGGQHAEYIISALKSYEGGQRQHATMHANAFTLSEADMQDIAAYLTGFESAKTAPQVRGNPAAGQEKTAACVACHGEDGNGNKDNPNPIYPRLAGQYEDYLRKALQDYQSGQRRNAIMSGMVQALSEQDQADLAAYYASRPNGLIVAKEN